MHWSQSPSHPTTQVKLGELFTIMFGTLHIFFENSVNKTIYNPQLSTYFMIILTLQDLFENYCFTLKPLNVLKALECSSRQIFVHLGRNSNSEKSLDLNGSNAKKAFISQNL